MDPILSLINDSQTIAVVSHVFPDGDAVGSLMGLTLGLESLGKTVIPVLRDPVPDVFSFLPTLERIKDTLPECDLCIVVDVSDQSRVDIADLNRQPLMVIDHHPKGDLHRTAQAIRQDEQASSVAEMIYGLHLELGVRITPQIATCLLTGIFTDTGGFQYANATSKALGIAAELMKRGAKLSSIAANISHTKSVASLKLLGIALDRLKITLNGRCAVSILTQKDIITCNAQPEDLAGIISELNSLPQVLCSILLTEISPGVIRGSLRTTEGKVTKVGSLAKILGGGGHPRASGFTIPGMFHFDSNGQWKIVPA